MPNDTPNSTTTPDDVPTPSSASPAEAPASVSSEPTLEQQLTQLKDLLLRRSAEFENYKRRVEQESTSTIRMANEGLVLAILPIVDDVDRSLKAGKALASGDGSERPKDQPDASAFYRGVELIAQKLAKVLESQGVRSFDSVGQPFDVHRHDALLQVPNGTVPPFTVLEEVERGYTMYDKVIRHAKVVVASAPPETPAAEG